MVVRVGTIGGNDIFSFFKFDETTGFLDLGLKVFFQLLVRGFAVNVRLWIEARVIVVIFAFFVAETCRTFSIRIAAACGLGLLYERIVEDLLLAFLGESSVACWVACIVLRVRFLERLFFEALRSVVSISARFCIRPVVGSFLSSSMISS